MRTRSVLAILVLAAACSSRKEPPPQATGSAAPPAVGSALAPPPVKAAPADAAPVEDPAVRAAYRAGMRTGRKATDAKNYAAAIGGFDAALAAKPNDARALGERGYARLLQGTDLDAASRDLDAAASGTKDQKLLSTIWFNRGLLHEKRGDATNATASFAIANLMRPTKAAASRLAGKQACPLEVLRTFSVDEYPPLKAADWGAVHELLPHDDDDKRSDLEPTLPAVVTAWTNEEVIAYAVWAADDQVFATTVGMHWGGRCPGSINFEIAAVTATHLHVTGSEEAMGGHTFMCEGKGDELEECTGADNEVSAGTACLGGGVIRRDVVIERATGKVVVAVEQPATGSAPPTISLAPKALTIRGQGCDLSERL